jgi:plasmid maintenance system antidote protein VapI
MARQGLFANRQPFDVTMKNPSPLEMTVRLEKSLGSAAAAWLRVQDNCDLAHVEASSIEVRPLQA